MADRKLNVMVSIDGDLLADVDREAKRVRLSRSGWLREAAREKLAKQERLRLETAAEADA